MSICLYEYDYKKECKYVNIGYMISIYINNKRMNIVGILKDTIRYKNKRIKE